MRTALARCLVRWAGRWMDASYASYCRTDGDNAYSRFWARGADYVQRFAFPVARRLDRDAMVDQMVKEGWWG